MGRKKMNSYSVHVRIDYNLTVKADSEEDANELVQLMTNEEIAKKAGICQECEIIVEGRA